MINYRLEIEGTTSNNEQVQVLYSPDTEIFIVLNVTQGKANVIDEIKNQMLDITVWLSECDLISFDYMDSDTCEYWDNMFLENIEEDYMVYNNKHLHELYIDYIAKED